MFLSQELACTTGVLERLVRALPFVALVDDYETHPDERNEIDGEIFDAAQAVISREQQR